MRKAYFLNRPISAVYILAMAIMLWLPVTVLEAAIISVTTNIDLHADKVRIIVSDTGKGIAESLLPDLFDRFTRGEEEGKDGCGLGLAICRSIIVSHGGTIDVESSPSGTQFIIELPLSQ